MKDTNRSKQEKASNSVIDNSKNFRVITHSLYLVANPKTGKIEQVCRTEKEKAK
jgi:hypothetical protein